LHKGDTLVFQVPKNAYVHFDHTTGKHPCKEDNKDLAWKGSKPPQCEVEADPKGRSFYLYLIDTNPSETENLMTKNSGRCPTWCPGTLVVSPLTPNSTEAPTKVLNQSDPNPAVEVAIYNLIGAPNPAYVNLGQQVTWINPGTDAPGWTVTFTDDICVEGKSIKSPGPCTIRADKTLPGYHSYTISVGDGNPGPTPSQLYVIPPPPTTDPPKPQ
jgi:hypothetical protein